MKLYASAILAMPIMAWLGMSIHGCARIDSNVERHIEAAANSLDTDTAAKELSKAIKWVEENKLTEGSTAVLWQCSRTDLGSWYRNLVDARDLLGGPPVPPKQEISYTEEDFWDEYGLTEKKPAPEVSIKAPIKALTLAEQAEVMGRVKSVLIKDGGAARVPLNISMYPYHRLMGWGLWGSMASLVMAVVLFAKWANKNN